MGRRRGIADHLINGHGLSLSDMALPNGYEQKRSDNRKENNHMRRKCMDCLWNWEDLEGGCNRKCYMNVSPNYHKPVSGSACAFFEHRLPASFKKRG